MNDYSMVVNGTYYHVFSRMDLRVGNVIRDKDTGKMVQIVSAGEILQGMHVKFGKRKAVTVSIHLKS